MDRFSLPVITKTFTTFQSLVKTKRTSHHLLLAFMVSLEVRLYLHRGNKQIAFGLSNCVHPWSLEGEKLQSNHPDHHSLPSPSLPPYLH
jgi:hypothetical protein